MPPSLQYTINVVGVGFVTLIRVNILNENPWRWIVGDVLIGAEGIADVNIVINTIMKIGEVAEAAKSEYCDCDKTRHLSVAVL